MSKPWSDKLRIVKPYVPGEQSKNKNIIKLNANENPYPPSPKVSEAIRNFNWENLKAYPDANAEKIVSALADFHGVEKNQIFVGNGSDDVIALCFMSFFNSSKPIVFPDITYSFYPVWCNLFNVPYETKPLDKDFRINSKDYYEENGGIILPNPNAPTGIGEGEDFLRDILDNNKDVIVIIDEAYVDFGCYSAIKLLSEYENLIIVHTFSKSRSLAGMRIGAAIGSPQLISLLNSVKNSYNSYTLDSVAIEAGTASILDNEYFENTLTKIIKTRKLFSKELKGLGFYVYPSSANFILTTHSDINAEELFESCKAENIFIRYFKLPRIENHLRITIGTEEEMEVLLNFIKKYIKDKSIK